MTTAQKPGQQQLAAAYRSLDRGTALARRIIGNHALVPLALLPSDVALVLIFEQNIPFGHWATHPTPHALAAFLDAHLARRPPEGIGAGMDRVGQNVVHGVVCRQSPDDAALLGIAGFDGQYDAFVTQPDMHLTSALELGEFGEDELQCVLDPLVRVLLDPVAPRLHIRPRRSSPRAALLRMPPLRRARNMCNSASLMVPFNPSKSLSLNTAG